MRIFAYAWRASCLLIDIVILPKIMKSTYHIKFNLKNSLKIHEENTKKITAVSVVLYVIKFHVNLQKI